MKHLLLFWFILCMLTSCNKDEGFGGSSSLEGYAYEVVHSDDNYSFQTDTFPALDTEVFIEFGDDWAVGERIRTGREGYYRFDYLREGHYTVYAVSKFADDHKEIAAVTVHVGGGLAKANPIFIHSGDAAGTAMVKGAVWAKFYNKGSLVRVNGQDSIPASEARVYIKYLGEDTFFDDVRVGDKGIFMFQKIQPGRQYEVYVNTEIPGEAYKNILFPIVKKIDVEKAYQTYPLENGEKLEFTIIVNN